MQKSNPHPCTCVSKRRLDMTGPLGTRVPAWLHSLWGMYYIYFIIINNSMKIIIII